jgi:L-alanine-DL-glutamate epimerase-like enolase superfamily enzyme
MKITGIETIRLGEFPNLLWLQIHTDQGLIGLGETFFGPRAVEAYIHETVAPLLIGKPALQIDRQERTLQTQ